MVPYQIEQSLNPMRLCMWVHDQGCHVHCRLDVNRAVGDRCLLQVTAWATLTGVYFDMDSGLRRPERETKDPGHLKTQSPGLPPKSVTATFVQALLKTYVHGWVGFQVALEAPLKGTPLRTPPEGKLEWLCVIFGEPSVTPKPLPAIPLLRPPGRQQMHTLNQYTHFAGIGGGPTQNTTRCNIGPPGSPQTPRVPSDTPQNQGSNQPDGKQPHAGVGGFAC